MNTLTIELPKETAEKLDLLKQAYEKKTGASISESTLVQTLISKEFIQAITPFDLQQFITEKELDLLLFCPTYKFFFSYFKG
ncbi:hypothetical protein BN2127_JRS10_04695 [Bacillus subtilis]|nr:hypothetical protein BN2127_JRS10_04695 [Bacillus subtilis]